MHNYLVFILILLLIVAGSYWGYNFYCLRKYGKKTIDKYDDGKKRRIYFIKDGEKNGIEKIYYRSSKLNKIKKYEHGCLDGLMVIYYENGEKYIEANYLNDNLIGEYRIYEDDGKIKETRLL